MAARRPAPRSRSRANATPPPGSGAIPYLAAVLGGIGGLVALWFGAPGLVVAWLGLVVGSWSAQMPVLTGVDLTKNPVPQGPRETRQYQSFQFFRSLKWGLVFPTAASWPGWPVLAAWVGGLLAAAVAWSLPHLALPEPGPVHLLRHLDAFFAHVLVTQVAAARRESVVRGDRSPGVRIDTLLGIGGTSLQSRLAVLGAVLLSGVTLAWVQVNSLPAPPTPDFASDVVGYAWTGVWFLAGALLGALAPWTKTALAHWREVVAARAEWEPRWAMLKQQAPPTLLDREHVGRAVVDSFRADGSMGSMAYLSMATKITPTLGGALRIAILAVPSKDSQGQPIPGSTDPLGFQIVAWPNDYRVSYADPDADPDEARLFLQCILNWVFTDAGTPPGPAIDEMTPIAVPSPPEETEPVEHEAAAEGGEAPEDAPAEPPAPGEPVGPHAQVWKVTLHGLPVGWEDFRKSMAGSVAGQAGAEALVDHRMQALFLGDLTDNPPALDPQAGITHADLVNLDREDTWNGRWSDVLKRDANPPTINHPTYAERALPGGTTVHRQAFVTRMGDPPTNYFRLEEKIAATLTAAPFVATCGWTTRGRPGERHPQAFTVYWSHQPVPPNPDRLPPTPQRGPVGRPRPGSPDPNEAQTWVLQGRMNEAFKASRLAQPEMYEARCLTNPRSPGHIWAMKVRLYDGVTLADVRGAAQRLRQALGSEWLRVEAAKDGCTIVAGASPKRVRLADERDAAYLVSLDWEQAFLDAKVVGVGGLTPVLLAADRLPHNQQVEVIDFTLPSGLAFVDVKAKSRALETSSRNAFVEVRRHPSGKADEFRILASEVNPMPERAPFDFEAAETGDDLIPFATNLFGEPTCYNNAVDAHLLVSGASGGGKSVALQSFIYGALIRHWDLYVVDPSKGAVDFNFAEPYARAVGRTVWEAKGIVGAIYDEVLRRKAINSAHNCGNYRDLPDEVRYNHVLIVLDEFTSMMMPEPVPKAMDDSPETLHAIESVKAINAARAYIGTYVGKIVREARSTGFTMLLATQALKADTLQKIPGANDLKDNMSRMIVGRASFGQLAAALKMPTEAPEQPDTLPPGRGLYEGNGRSAEVIQCWFEPSQRVFAENLASRARALSPDERVDLSGFVEPELEVDGARMDDRPIPTSLPGPTAAAEQVIDIGDFAFSLDDLEGLVEEDWEATEDGAAEPQHEDPSPAEPPRHAAAPPTPSPVPGDPEAQFDWDAAEEWAQMTAGAEADLAPDDLDWTDADPTEPLRHEPEPEQASAPATEPASPEEGDDTVAVADTVVWDEVDPTAWEPAASEYGWTEIEAVLGFLADFPQVHTLVWTDPRLNDEDDLGIPLADVVTELLDERGVRLVRGVEQADTQAPAPATTTPTSAPAPALPEPPAHPVIDSDDEFGPPPTLPDHLRMVDNPFE